MKCFYFQDRHQRHLWTTLNTKFSFQVIEEKDYPPTANAGEDKVVYLPINQVTLHGNQSSDDHGIVSWEWTLNEGKVALASLSLEVILIFLPSSKQMHKITVLSSFQLSKSWFEGPHFCVEFWELSHLTRDLSQIEKKILLQAEQMHKVIFLSLKMV